MPTLTLDATPFDELLLGLYQRELVIYLSNLHCWSTVHTSDPSVVVNPHDHFDHRMAGLLVYDLRKQSKWNVAYYTGYALATRAANRSEEQIRQKTSLFLAYDKVMTEANPKWSAYRERPAFYSQCMLRTYARKIASP